MSGIEAAGLVLAVFPLLVSGLTQFAAGVRTIKEWKRYHRELSNYSRILEAQEVYYRDTIDELLDGIIHSDEEYEALINEPGGMPFPNSCHLCTQIWTAQVGRSTKIPNYEGVRRRPLHQW